MKVKLAKRIFVDIEIKSRQDILDIVDELYSKTRKKHVEVELFWGRSNQYCLSVVKSNQYCLSVVNDGGCDRGFRSTLIDGKEYWFRMDRNKANLCAILMKEFNINYNSHG